MVCDLIRRFATGYGLGAGPRMQLRGSDKCPNSSGVSEKLPTTCSRLTINSSLVLLISVYRNLGFSLLASYDSSAHCARRRSCWSSQNDGAGNISRHFLPDYASWASSDRPGRASERSPRRQPRVRVRQKPSPGRRERIGMRDCYILSFARPGAHSSICLVPRLTPWAMTFRLFEANSIGA